MAPDTVLTKTVRGKEEIRTRAHALTGMQRRLLILVDGKRSMGQIAEELGRSATDPMVLRDLKWLLHDRYVGDAGEVENVA